MKWRPVRCKFFSQNRAAISCKTFFSLSAALRTFFVVSMHLLRVVHFPSQLRAATFEVQLNWQQSGSTRIFLNSQRWKELLPSHPLPKEFQTCQFRDHLRRSPFTLLEHFPKHPTKLPVSNQSSLTPATGTNALKHNHFESNKVDRRAATSWDVPEQYPV